MVIFEKQISCPIQVLLFELSSKESYFSCKTDAILFLWLQRPTSCTLLSTQTFLCKKFWRREKSGQTSNKSRITGPSNLRLCANFKFETRPSPQMIKNTFGKRFWTSVVKKFEKGSVWRRGQISKVRDTVLRPSPKKQAQGVGPKRYLTWWPQNAGIMVIFEKQISCPIQLLLFELSSKEWYFSCKTDVILFLWLQRPTTCTLLKG